MDCLFYHNMLHTLELNYGMLGSHMNMFIWQGIILLFFIIFPLMVKFLLAACKERCEDGACWYRRVEAAHGPLSEELVEEGPLEARTTLCDTDSLLSGPLQCVPPHSFGDQEAVGAGLCLCSLGLLYTRVLRVVRCISVGWVTGSCHSCVPSPTARAGMKGGSLLTSPRQNPVESSGMRAGGRSAAEEAIFLWHLPLRLSSGSVLCCGSAWGLLTIQPSTLQCLQASLTPHPWPSSSLSLSREQRRPWHSQDSD